MRIYCTMAIYLCTQLNTIINLKNKDKEIRVKHPYFQEYACIEGENIQSIA